MHYSQIVVLQGVCVPTPWCLSFLQGHCALVHIFIGNWAISCDIEGLLWNLFWYYNILERFRYLSVALLFHY